MAYQQYDVVFVGGGLPSLVAATVLAKRGKKILFLDPVQPSDPNSPDASFHFSIGPHLYFGYENGGAMEGFFSEIAFAIPSLKQRGFRYQKVDPLLQVVLPGHRVNLYKKEADYQEELAREFPGEQTKMKTLLKEAAGHAAGYYPFLGKFPQLESRGIGERLDVWKKRHDFEKAAELQKKQSAPGFIEQYQFSADMLEHFNLLSLFAFSLPFAEISAFDWVRLLSAFQKGGCRMPGGYPSLARFFSRLIKNSGGKVMQGKAITRVEMNGKEIDSLVLSDDSLHASRYFIISKPPGETRIDFFFTIDGNLIPGPMKDTLLMTWGESPPPGLENILVIHLNLEKGGQDVVSESRQMMVSLLPFSGEVFSEEERKVLEGKVLERLHWLIPFSESKIRTVAPDRPSGNEWDRFFPVEGEGTDNRAKRKSKGILQYLKPKKYKNVFIVSSEQSELLGWGTSFLEGMDLAGLLEK